MAVPFTEINAITQKFFVKKLVDNIFDSNPLFQRWKKNNYQSVEGGTSLMVPVAYATTTASAWYSGSDTLDTSANDQITAAEFDWKQIHSSITITKLDELKNAGPLAMVDFVKSKVQLAEKTIKDNLGTALYNVGTAANEIVGLRAMVDASRTYGGINSSTNTWWDCQEDTTTTTLTMKALQALEGDVKIDNDRPSVHMTTQDIFDTYYALLQPQQRFQDDDTARGGFVNLIFNGKPVIVDSHCPASHWFMLNEDYIMLKYHKDENFRFEPFIKPTNQNVSVAHIFWTGALCGSNPRMQAKFTGLTS